MWPHLVLGSNDAPSKLVQSSGDGSVLIQKTPLNFSGKSSLIWNLLAQQLFPKQTSQKWWWRWRYSIFCSVMQASPLQCNLNFYDLCTTQKHWHIVSFMMEKCNILGISIIKLVLGRPSGWIIPSILPVPYRKIKHTTKVSRWSRILNSISFSKIAHMAHLRAQWEQSGHSESMMEGQGTRTVAWTQEKKDFTDLPLGRVKESPAVLGHQAKNAASSSLPSKKQSIVRNYVSCFKNTSFPSVPEDQHCCLICRKALDASYRRHCRKNEEWQSNEKGVPFKWTTMTVSRWCQCWTAGVCGSIQIPNI